MRPPRLALALDIGGTKLAAAVIDETGAIIAAHRVRNPQGTDGDLLFDALTTAADAALKSAGTEPGDPRLVPAIGVGTAAPLDLEAGTVSPVNIPAWRAYPLRDRLIERYQMDVGLIGDAVAVADQPDVHLVTLDQPVPQRVCPPGRDVHRRHRAGVQVQRRGRTDPDRPDQPRIACADARR